MKKNLLLTVLFSILLNGALFSQLAIQNGSFEDPAEDIKYRADGEGDTEVFNGNVPGWWADTSATDCGRQNSAKPAYDGDYTGYGFNNDGTIWAVAGTVPADMRQVYLTFYAWESFPQGQTGVSIVAKFAVFEGTDTVGFNLLDSLVEPFDPALTDADGWELFDFTYTIPASEVGKTLLVGYDLSTETADNSWFSFDNFMLVPSQAPDGIEQNISGSENIKAFPNPTSDFITIQTGNNLLNRYALYSVTGREVLSGTVNQSITIDIRSLNKGIYFLKIENSRGSQVVKTVIK